MKKAAMEQLKSDFVTALKIVSCEGLSDAFAHVSARVDGQRMLFMPRKSPDLVKKSDLFLVDFEKQVSQSTVHQAVYKARSDVQAVLHFHAPSIVLLTLVGRTIRPLHNYSAMFYEGVPLFDGPGQVETPERAAEIARILGSGKAVLLRGHGAVVVGKSIREACILSLYLQETARLEAEASRLGAPQYIPADEAERMARRTFKPESTARAWDHFAAKVKR
jgi:HCOMODA/2-hydroxy-3-carboxy-muconic semialdehyde decarboxylase